MSKKRNIVRMCGQCLGSGHVWKNGKRVRCEACRGAGVVTVVIEVDDGQPEEQGR